MDDAKLLRSVELKNTSERLPMGSDVGTLTDANERVTVPAAILCSASPVSKAKNAARKEALAERVNSACWA